MALPNVAFAKLCQHDQKRTLVKSHVTGRSLPPCSQPVTDRLLGLKQPETAWARTRLERRKAKVWFVKGHKPAYTKLPQSYLIKDINMILT